ncbi:hypothetical protein HPQ64_04230 [Rhizobiales bacterium]|uniref:hypothetical protein n=1 Tax=Hongsoonwoonella zoysiae TaxID=2821844 RepID=UPI001561AC28|nr:hypothetical protein [Hongsoonwoonella zoysiae]
MWDIFLQFFSWSMLAFFSVQALVFIALALRLVWTEAIRPRLIPADDIARVADDIIATYPDPELEAFARHERAWYRCDGAEQTYWYRVRKAIRRRL